MHYNSMLFGVITGFVAPLFGFLAYGLIYVTAIRPHHDLPWFIHDLFLGTRQYQSPVISLALLANLALFFVYDKYHWYAAMRGVILATLIYGAIIVVLVFR